ncbi:MAG: hypothetical protein JNN07_00580 [Verrucomicrobiales bacterium]|nr:hypothetical protein [Verrucomicrobiales bacterium]
MNRVPSRGRFVLLPLVAAFTLGLVFAFRATTEFQSLPSPDGRFTAVIEYSSWRSLVPMVPGSSSDKPGFVTIYSSDGRSLGRAPVPMLQLARDFQWEADAAEIPLIARWDLSRGSVTVHSQ